MNELYYQALDAVEVGIIIIDSDLNIVSWNGYIERITLIKRNAALNKKLDEVCKIFALPRYQEILQSVFLYNQCRFCSSKLHGAFVYPMGTMDNSIRQNMSVQPITTKDGIFALIQIFDITFQVNSERKMTSFINKMTKGYNEIKESEELNKRLAVTDPLTGLLNRFALTQKVMKIFSTQQDLSKYALMFLDMDGFKHVNDTYGHATGDKLLVKIAERIKMVTRENDVVSRIGGDEFVVVVRSSNNEGIEAVAQKLVRDIGKAMVIDGKVIKVTVSVGVAVMDKCEKNAADIIRKADLAMYDAKKKGKNTYSICGVQSSPKKQ